MHICEIADAGVGGLRVISHVLEDHQSAATRPETAQIRIGRVHQAGDLEHTLLVILGLVLRYIEGRIAREDILYSARAVDPCDPVGLDRRPGPPGPADAPG